MSFDLAVVLGFLLVSAAFLWLLLTVGKLIRMAKPKAEKLTTYECGEKPFGQAWFNFNNRFYIIALVFVAFDVQVALVIPVIVEFRRLIAGQGGATSFAITFGYLSLMMLTLAYVWRHGDLSWVRDIAGRQTTKRFVDPAAEVRVSAPAAAMPAAAAARRAEGSV